MTKSALFGAAALLSVMAATPVTAQEVIYNPGYCAQFYPNANCQNKGPNNPYTGDYQLRRGMRGAYAWSGGPFRQGAGVFRGRGGRRPYLYLFRLKQTRRRRSPARGLFFWRHPPP